ncbi:MAG: guanylate kinase [Eggerthellaceae bacterium]|nr:guanylate kinase [Eggerthellaceae bacterium]
MRQGNLFVVSGPSGAGKGTLVAHLLQELPDAWVSVSVTTRKPRKDEIEGKQYFFVDDAHFDALIEQDALLEWAYVYGGCRYGTLRKTVEEHIACGQQVILEIDVQGAFQVKEKMPAAHLVFIEPPDLTVLEKRLRGRGTETQEMIEKRLDTAKVELSQKMEYDVRLINDDLDEAVAELVSFINECAD